MKVALITGASAGLGRALAKALAEDSWTLAIDARRAERLQAVVNELSRIPQSRRDATKTEIHAVVGDVSSAAHRQMLWREIAELGRLDLLVNNASTLGPTPLPPLAQLDPVELSAVFQINVVSPLSLIQDCWPLLRASSGTIVNISSDAAVEHYEGWGAYGSSKAAFDHVTATLAAENPAIRVYAFDPGDMRTEMHQNAFPGEDISDRPLPEAVVGSLLELLTRSPASGRYRAADFAIAPVAS